MRRDTAGNPLFVAQLLRHLEETGALVERDGELSLAARDAALGVPESAKELVGARLAALDPGRRAALRTAAVIGRAFGHELLAAVDERPADAVLDALEAGIAAGLVEETAPGRHAFVHALVREAIYEQMGRDAARATAPPRRRGARGVGGRPTPPSSRTTSSPRATGSRGSSTRGQRASAPSASSPTRTRPPTTEHALDALGRRDRARRCELLLALGDARAREGDTPASKRAYREAAELAETLGAARASWRARRSATAAGSSGRSRATIPYARAAARARARRDRRGDDPLRVRLLARLGGGPLRDAPDPRRRRAITTEALEAARRLGDPPTLAYALDGYISAHHSPDSRPPGRAGRPS